MTNSFEGEMSEQLSGDARTIFDSIPIRRHGVNLERVQRIHLGVDSEEMEFSAQTLADMLQEIADRIDENDAFTIHAIVNALLGRDDHHELVLKQKKRGKFVNPTVHEAKRNRQMKWLWWLAHLENQGIKTESAVATIAKSEKASRAAVFNGVKEAEKFQAWGRDLAPDAPAFQNPRPAKTRKG